MEVSVRSLTFALTLLVAAPVSAEMLLVTATWKQDATVGLPAWYGAQLSGLPFDADGLEADSGVVDSLPSESVAGEHELAAWNDYNFRLGIRSITMFVWDFSDGPLSGPSYDSTWNTAGRWEDGFVSCAPNPEGCDPGTWTITASAPYLGAGLEGYFLTRADRTIDASGQTLRVYGKPAVVPEPSSLWVMLFAMAFHFRGRHLR
jgi:hypothetical protein